jgi:hypothetical protein
MGFGGFLMLDIKYIAFACYPPRSDTSHDGGLVGLNFMSHESYMNSYFLHWWIVTTLKVSSKLSYTAFVIISLFIKKILTRRQRNKWDVDYLPLLLLIEVRWICASSHLLVMCLYGTVSSNERKAPNKAAL